MNRHRWADVITAWANGDTVQFRHWRQDGFFRWQDWTDDSTPHFCDPQIEWRIKPRMCSLNGYEFPAPERVPPERDVRCWCPCPTRGDYVTDFIWHGPAYETDMNLLRRGRIHLSKDAAIAHARAEILAVGGTLENDA